MRTKIRAPDGFHKQTPLQQTPKPSAPDAKLSPNLLHDLMDNKITIYHKTSTLFLYISLSLNIVPFPLYITHEFLH